MKRITNLLVLLLFAGLAFAQTEDDVVISPQAIVVNPVQAFDVNVFLDRQAPAGNQFPIYNVGDTIRIGVTVGADSYIYLFNVRSDGRVVQILPNQLETRDNFLRAGETRHFPPQGAPYTFNLAPPTGLEKVIALASQTRLDPATLRGFQQEGDFRVSALGESDFAESLAIVVRPIQRDRWATDTELFYVTRSGQPAPQAIYGTLDIRSEPAGSRAYVDGRFVGFTPVRFGTTAGEYTVRVEREGHQPRESRVQLAGGQTRTVQANLERVQQRGSLLVQGNVGGAVVTLDGQNVGTLASGSGELVVRDLRPGTYTLRVTAPNFTTVQRSVTIRSGERSQVSVEQRRQTGSAQFTSQPTGVTVTVGNDRIGTTPVTATLPTGRHEAVFQRAGYETVRVEFEVRAGATTNVSARLERTVSQQAPAPAPAPAAALWDRLDLAEYPGSTLVRLDGDRGRVRAEFETAAGLQTVYNHFHAQLRAAGWQRQDLGLQETAGRATAEYTLRADELELRLNRLGNGRYRLELWLNR